MIPVTQQCNYLAIDINFGLRTSNLVMQHLDAATPRCYTQRVAITSSLDNSLL